MLSFTYFSKWRPFIEIIKLWTSEHMVCLLCFDRDLKPTNVLLDEDNRPVLMDLGSMNRARIEVRAQGLNTLGQTQKQQLQSLHCSDFNETEFNSGERNQGSHDHTGLGSPAVHHFLQGS